ncbi:MAG: HNH endonuclease [Bacteroidales bacterium]|nr:HNH endonuclease [Bacteroidales bacterium]
MRGRILKLKPDRDGYPRVSLKFGEKVKLAGVHRLVAQAFIPNPDNLPCVNHKDYHRDNNCVSNLEWCSVEYNNHYSENELRRPHSMYARIGNLSATRMSKPVRCIETGQVFASRTEAELHLGIWRSSVIHSLQTGRPVGDGRYTFEVIDKQQNNL